MFFNGKYLVFYLEFQRTLSIFAKKTDSKQIKIRKNYGNIRAKRKL